MSIFFEFLTDGKCLAFLQHAMLQTAQGIFIDAHLLLINNINSLMIFLPDKVPLFILS